MSYLIINFFFKCLKVKYSDFLRNFKYVCVWIFNSKIAACSAKKNLHTPTTGALYKNRKLF